MRAEWTASLSIGSEAPVPPLPGLPGMEGEPLVQLGLLTRVRPEDFRVEELGGVRPSGDGEHVLFSIRKRGLDTPGAIDRMSRKLGVPRGEFGRAGLKDARAVTTQVLSVRGADPAAVSAAGDEDLEVLWAERHREKLRPGQLAGNRFTLVLRPADRGPIPPETAARVRDRMARMAERGLLNGFGAQRLGPRDRSARAGVALLRGDAPGALELLCGTPTERDRGAVRRARECFAVKDLAGAASGFPPSHAVERRLCERLLGGRAPAEALGALPRARRRLHLNAAQALVFQTWLAARRESPARLLAGDVVRKTTGRGTFRVDDVSAEQPRSDRFEIQPMGPLFGRKLFPAAQSARALELEVLAAHGLEEGLFGAAKLDGSRRPLRVPVTNAASPELIEDDLGPGLRLRFELPSGSYATTVLTQLEGHPASP